MLLRCDWCKHKFQSNLDWLLFIFQAQFLKVITLKTCTLNAFRVFRLGVPNGIDVDHFQTYKPKLVCKC